MENTRSLKRKIATVNKIEQITNAMKVVATNRLRKIETRAQHLADYARRLQAVAARLTDSLGAEAHPLLVRRSPVRSALVIAIGGDRGLCGAYNANVFRVLEELVFLRRQMQELQFVALGSRMVKSLQSHDYDLLLAEPLDSDPASPQPAKVASLASDLFLAGKVDEVLVVFTRYVNPLVYRPTQQQLLPFSPPEASSDEQERVLEKRPYEFEPSAAELLDALLPWQLQVQVEAMILESAASEFAARVSAMTNASDNAADMSKVLTLNYNRVRQAAITSEILEVAAGAEALTQD